MPMSDADMLFESEAYKQVLAQRENEINLQMAIINRLDAVIKSFAALAKAR